MSNFPEPTTLELSGANTPDGSGAISMSVYEAGPADGFPVVLCHGFPELAYSWRHQIPAIADAGFRVIAPDQRGYGNTTAPEDISSFGVEHLTGDLVDMLDALDIEKAIFVGHDWGGFIAWAMPVLFPDRTEAVAGVCTPNTPFPTTELLLAMFGEVDKMYMLWFQEPGVAEGFMDKHVEATFNNLMVGGRDPEESTSMGERREGMDFNPFKRIEELTGFGDPIATSEELDRYIDTFNRTGFRGGINWYRNIDANAEAYPGIGTTPLDLPTLMITAEWDPALPPAFAAGMGELCSDLEMHMVEKAGHWVQQEYPNEVNGFLVDWLKRRFPQS